MELWTTRKGSSDLWNPIKFSMIQLLQAVWFPIADVKSDHKVSGLKQCKFVSYCVDLQVRNQVLLDKNHNVSRPF